MASRELVATARNRRSERGFSIGAVGLLQMLLWALCMLGVQGRWMDSPIVISDRTACSDTIGTIIGIRIGILLPIGCTLVLFSRLLLFGSCNKWNNRDRYTRHRNARRWHRGRRSGRSMGSASCTARYLAGLLLAGVLGAFHPQWRDVISPTGLFLHAHGAVQLYQPGDASQCGGYQRWTRRHAWGSVQYLRSQVGPGGGSGGGRCPRLQLDWYSDGRLAANGWTIGNESVAARPRPLLYQSYADNGADFDAMRCNGRRWRRQSVTPGEVRGPSGRGGHGVVSGGGRGPRLQLDWCPVGRLPTSGWTSGSGSFVAEFVALRRSPVGWCCMSIGPWVQLDGPWWRVEPACLNTMPGTLDVIPFGYDMRSFCYRLAWSRNVGMLWAIRAWCRSTGDKVLCFSDEFNFGGIVYHFMFVHRVIVRRYIVAGRIIGGRRLPQIRRNWPAIRRWCQEYAATFSRGRWLEPQLVTRKFFSMATEAGAATVTLLPASPKSALLASTWPSLGTASAYSFLVITVIISVTMTVTVCVASRGRSSRRRTMDLTDRRTCRPSL